jgi:hypothetical protein
MCSDVRHEIHAQVIGVIIGRLTFTGQGKLEVAFYLGEVYRIAQAIIFISFKNILHKFLSLCVTVMSPETA